MADVTRLDVAIHARDGACPAALFRPSGAGPRPAVIVYMDAFGVRPAIDAVAERIAARGYVALVPDFFYRVGAYQAPDPAQVLGDPARRAAWFDTYAASANQANVMSDTAALLEFLARHGDVAGPQVATTGYCMGGGLALAAAGHFPERVAAAASFHGGRLATDAPDSPHLLAPRVKARVYVAGAVEDASFSDEMKKRLEEALAAAGVRHTVETYLGMRHGWVIRDMPVYDAAGAARHDQALFALLDATLGA